MKYSFLYPRLVDLIILDSGCQSPAEFTMYTCAERKVPPYGQPASGAPACFAILNGECRIHVAVFLTKAQE